MGINETIAIFTTYEDGYKRIVKDDCPVEVGVEDLKIEEEQKDD